jgi:hypothetical protein
MNAILRVLLLLAAAASASGCQDKDALLLLRARAEFYLVGTGAVVALVRRADFDRLGYRISVPKQAENPVQRAFEYAGGKECWRLLVDRGGCHYNSARGCDIFVERNGPGDDLIYTSGWQVGRVWRSRESLEVNAAAHDRVIQGLAFRSHPW